MGIQRVVLNLDPNRQATPPKKAATVIVVRDRKPQGLEVFFVRRNAKSAFLGGAVVFPGGKVDEADASEATLTHTVGTPQRGAELTDVPHEQRALGVCACRELLEEAALALLTTPIDDGKCEGLRTELGGGTSFGELLAREDLTLDLASLHSFGRWVTPKAESRRYDASFFLARAPEDQTGKHDTHETISSVWATPKQMLDASVAGEVFLAPPTTRCLELLLSATTVTEAFAVADSQALQPVCPELLPQDPPVLVLPGDPAHSEPTPVVGGPSRFVLRDGRFCSETPSD